MTAAHDQQLEQQDTTQPATQPEMTQETLDKIKADLLARINMAYELFQTVLNNIQCHPMTRHGANCCFNAGMTELRTGINNLILAPVQPQQTDDQKAA